MPNPAYDGNNDKTIPVNYSWVETVEDKTESFLVPDATKMTVNSSSATLGGKKNFTKSSTGKSGGGGDSKPQKVEHIEDKPDRYHDVDIELKKLSNTLEKLNSQMDKFTGKTKLDNLKKQFQLIGDEVDRYKEKINIARSEMDELQKSLSYQGVKFNADGTISNYTQVYQQEVNRRNADIDW
jgi:peptidoglycan hydrolase CwlO-like protein